MKKLSRILSVLMALCLVVTVMPTVAWAKSNSYVMLHPSSGTTPTGVKVQVGDRINGYEITSISGYDIIIDLGTYNVSLNNFRIPMPEEVWEGVAMQYNPQTYVIAGTAGAAHKTPGSNALLGNGGNTFYYYNLGKASGGGGGGETPDGIPYTVVHKYYTDGNLDGTVTKSGTKSSPTYIYASDFYEYWYRGEKYSDAEYDKYMVYVQKNQTNKITITYSRTEQVVPSYTYKVTYNGNGQTGGATAEQEKTTSATECTFSVSECGFIKTGYHFVGWGRSKSEVDYEVGDSLRLYITSPTIRLYAIWEKDESEQTTYTLRYDANGGTGGPANQIYTTTDEFWITSVSSQGPTRDGYTFKGWQSGDTLYTPASTNRTVVLTKDNPTMTLVAQWEQNAPPAPTTYTVRYTDGVDGEEVFADQITENLPSGATTPAFVGTPAREGYEFVGWYPKVAETVTDNATYTAQWQKNAPPAPTTYTVRYTDGVDGEEVFADQIHTVEEGATTPAFVGTPAREGYEFVGWTPEVEATVTDNVIYTARWEEVEETVYTYRLAYEANAGDSTVSGMPAGKTVKTDAAAYVFSVSSDRPAREGYTFQGWSTTAGGPVEYQGGDRIYLPGVPGEEISVTLFAVWEKSPVPPTPVDPDPKPDPDPDPDPEPDPYIPPYIPPTPVRPDPDPVRPDPDVEILDEEVPLAGAIGLNLEDHFAYIAGYPDGTVRPDGNITRAEVATIFFRLLTEETRAIYWSQTNDYSDVAPEAWYNNAVSTLSSMEVLSGYPDGTFKPNAPITRAEFAKIAVSFFDCAGIVYDGTFSDVAEGQWWTEYIAAAAELGLVEGYPDGTFKPQANISRAESCAIVNRVLERKPHEEHLLPEAEMIVWPDNADKAVWYYADIQEATNSHDYELAETETAEQWTEKLPERDWPALEKEWADASAAPGGEVIG